MTANLSRGKNAAAVLQDPGCVSTAPADRVRARVLFGILVVFHLWAVSIGWESGLLQGNEFRQTQTALTTLFVQREGNFTLAYPTPVLGKPWSVPMEFPLYQWSVAVLSSTTGVPLIQAARLVSAACFYLSLPAVWLLLMRLHLNPAQRWVALSMLLTCPLYIFYARGFLIETMALMFSLWFLQGFVAAVEQRSPFWLVVANVAGVGAGLVKITTFMLYLLPAGILGVVWITRAGLLRVRSSADNRPSGDLARRVGWMAACLVVPFATAYWWVQTADLIKSLNPSGAQLVSSLMSPYHFGTWQTRFSSEPWVSHWNITTSHLSPLAGLAVFLVITLLYGRRWKKWILVASLLFIAAPITFPVLYAWHEYYFVANGVFLMAAVGLALSAMLESPAPRWLVWSVIVGLHGLQVWAFFQFLYPTQRLPYEGGSGLTRLLRDVTEPDDVLLIAGNDWSSVIPFYSERRALMIRTKLENDEQYLQKAFSGIADESVPVFILVDEMRENKALLDRVSRQFGIDDAPFLIHKNQTIYVSRRWREEYARRLFNLSYNDVSFADPSERLISNEPQLVSAMRSTRFFHSMKPQPNRYQVPFGLTFGFRPDGSLVFDAHAPSRLWFNASQKNLRASLSFGIAEDAFTRSGDRTDGVEFAVVQYLPNDEQRILFSQFLDPVRRIEDRSTQHVELDLEVSPGAEIVFETRPGPSGSNAFDWSYWKKIELR